MTDTLHTIICPACGKAMKKQYVAETDTVLDICSDGCGGVFFDNQELKHFDEKHESIDKIQEILDGKSFAKVDSSETRICPICNVPMVKNCSSGTNEIQIDECYTCGGKFLDYDELNKIREEFETDEDRTVHFTNKVFKQIGKDLLASEVELELLKQQRSPLKKFFDKYIWKS